MLEPPPTPLKTWPWDSILSLEFGPPQDPGMLCSIQHVPSSGTQGPSPAVTSLEFHPGAIWDNFRRRRKCEDILIPSHPKLVPSVRATEAQEEAASTLSLQPFPAPSGLPLTAPTAPLVLGNTSLCPLRIPWSFRSQSKSCLSLSERLLPQECLLCLEA